jgi:putative glutathione S-transferase
MMGLLVDGVWRDVGYDTASTQGRFVRSDTQFRGSVSSEPNAEHPVAAGRYHLYVAMACPWAHRAILARKLLGLERAVSMSVVDPEMLQEGWTFSAERPDHLFRSATLHAVYSRANPTYSGRVTVPLLWDKQTGTIVNNESAEILRMFNGPFRTLGDPDALLAGHDLFPRPLQSAIDELNTLVYRTVNNGVYRAGFATRQEAYEEAVTELFATLDVLERRLGESRWLFGATFTEADLRLFTTLVRFDTVYHGHFKCNIRTLREYPNLWAYTRAIYQLPHVAEVCDFVSIKRHYYYSHPTINPTRIVPVGPHLDFGAAHGRGEGI